MKLIFLGSGSAFVPISENFQSNMLVESASGKRLLIDCGTDVRHSLKAIDLSYKDIDSVYISHLHADHAGGLEWLAFSTKFDPLTAKPKLFIHPSMVDKLWNNVLSGGLQSIQGNSPATIQTFFILPPVKDNKYFLWESIQFELVKTIHVYNGRTLAPSYGLFFILGTTNIFLTTDTMFVPENYMDYYKKADIIFHECETTVRESGVHTHFKQLATLAPEVKSKIWLYHYAEGPLPDAKAHGFQGFISRGQKFEF